MEPFLIFFFFSPLLVDCCRLSKALANCPAPSHHSRFFHMEPGNDLEFRSDDKPGIAHLTDKFHFMCPCATLSALVHAQTNPDTPSANTQRINEHISSILEPIQPARYGVLSPASSFFTRQGVQSRKAKHAAFCLIQP